VTGIGAHLYFLHNALSKYGYGAFDVRKLENTPGITIFKLP